MTEKQNESEKKNNVIKRLLSGSVIISFLLNLADRIYSLAFSSAVGGFLSTGYQKLRENAQSSVCFGVVKRISKMNFFRTAKHKVIKAFDGSLIISEFQKSISALSLYTLKYYGIFFLSYGICGIVTFLLKQYLISSSPETTDLICSLIFVAISVPMFFFDSTLREAFYQSRVVDFICFRLLGFKKATTYEMTYRQGGKNYSALIAGILFGICTLKFNPIVLIAVPIVLIACYVVICSPEIGVVLMVGMLPFLPTMALVALMLLTVLSYFLKLIRGKRTLRVEVLDVIVVLFMIALLSGGLFSISVSDSLKAAAVFVCFMFGYILVVNLMKTSEWVMRCVKCLLISLSVVSLIGILQYVTGSASSTWQDSTMFSDISGRVVSTFENPNVLAEYLIMTMPFAAALFVRGEKPGQRFASIVCFALSVLCLILTWSRGAWLGILFGGVLLLLIYSRKTLVFLFAGVLSIPFLPIILPDNIVSRFTSIGNLGDSSTSYRVMIWRGVWSLLGDYFTSGIGIGTEAFKAVYPFYAYAGIESAPHSHNLFTQITVEIGIVGLIIFVALMVVFLQSSFGFFAGSGASVWNRTEDEKKYKLMNAAGMCGISAVLVQGMTDYIWYNYRVFLAFWLVVGLTCALRRSAINELVVCRKDIY